MKSRLIPGWKTSPRENGFIEALILCYGMMDGSVILHFLKFICIKIKIVHFIFMQLELDW